MPSPTTAGTLINSALRLGNLIGIDAQLGAAQQAEALLIFNDLLEQFSTENLAVWDSPNQNFTLIPGQAMHTIGPSGDFNTTRPVDIFSPMYTTVNGVTFPCTAMTQQEYNLIAIKGQTQSYPNRFLYVNEYPLAQITFWPVPSAANTITLSFGRLLVAAASTATVLSFPPGYAKAFKYRLHCDLTPLFGKEPKASVVKEKDKAISLIMKANVTPRVSQMDPALMQNNAVPWQRGW